MEAQDYNEIYDQASTVGFILNSHLQTHGGLPDPECVFCKALILNTPSTSTSPLESYKFIILDVSERK